MPLLLGALPGCHVFEALDIPCVAGEPCGGADDSAAGEVATTGWIVSYARNPQGLVVLHGPDGAELRRWTDPGPDGGPVAWSRDAGAGVLAEGPRVFDLTPGADPTALAAAPADVDVRDVDRVGADVWAALGDNVWRWSADRWLAVFPTDLPEAPHVGLGEGEVYATAESGGFVGVFRVDPGALTWETLVVGLDPPRARNVFAGPDDLPFACSTAGAVYSVDGLDRHDLAPAAFPDATLTDVLDCGYDPGDGRFLLFSATAGVMKIDARGRTEMLTPVPAGYAGVRANFFR